MAEQWEGFYGSLHYMYQYMYNVYMTMLTLTMYMHALNFTELGTEHYPIYGLTKFLCKPLKGNFKSLLEDIMQAAQTHNSDSV